MASIHISEIQKILVERGEDDASVHGGSKGGFFLEIRFDDPSGRWKVTDEDYQNQVLVVESYLGTVTIVFDSSGALRSIDIS